MEAHITTAETELTEHLLRRQDELQASLSMLHLVSRRSELQSRQAERQAAQGQAEEAVEEHKRKWWGKRGLVQVGEWCTARMICVGSELLDVYGLPAGRCVRCRLISSNDWS